MHHGPDLGRGAGLRALSSRDDLIVPAWDVRRLTAALICTSDVHTVKGALPVPDGRTLGHESVGVIHQLGSAVTGFEVGQRVAVCAVTPYYRCHYCQRGFTSQCGGALGGYKYTVQARASTRPSRRSASRRPSRPACG